MEELVRALIDVLEVVFAIGMVGSAIVLLLSGIEDTRTVLEEDEPTPGAEGRIAAD